jgi:UDP-N-acetylmuramate--alanine ligase
LIATQKRYHFVGIGGSGMSGLASVMMAQGASVSGSDLQESGEVKRLRSAGASIDVGHDSHHVDRPLDGVIVSSAIAEDNVEVAAAREREIPVMFRLHALASVMSRFRSIGIAGTHGKSTTTAMAATILRETEKDPSFLIGAQCPALGGNAHLGTGEWFVAEIDESDGLFVEVRPTIAVLTNVGKDHLHTYRDLGEIERAFRRYAHGAKGAVLAVDDPRLRRLASTIPGAMTVGFHETARLRPANVRPEQFATTFDVRLDRRHVARLCLPAPGRHNVTNALCAIGASVLVGVDPARACAALESFALPHRRFELLEENGVTVIDDYAHLPEEVEATLQAIRAGWPGRRIVAVFQPHRYTRTRDLGHAFGAAFAGADVAIVTDIYPACEAPIPGVTSQIIVDAIRERCDARVFAIPDKGSALAHLKASIEPGDFIVSFGAGDIWTVTEDLAEFLVRGEFLRRDGTTSVA